ncbi:hypothetical protein N8381_05120 [Oceanospirillaceae bacterium]|nr:hypothetical protein [Oceanospirillaceae bacterium]
MARWWDVALLLLAVFFLTGLYTVFAYVAEIETKYQIQNHENNISASSLSMIGVIGHELDAVIKVLDSSIRGCTCQAF